MCTRHPEDVRGLEYDWLACDGAGHVALLSTAGGGFTPEAFLADTDTYDRAIEAIQRLPVTSAIVMAPDVKHGLPNVWKSVAARGLFSFDADANGGPYRLVGVPAEPVVVTELPQAVADVAKRTELRVLRFAAVTEISRDDLLMSQRRR